jgi:hypothetical protein
MAAMAQGHTQDMQATFERMPMLGPLDQVELSELAADGAGKENAWAAEYRGWRKALLQNPAWKLLSRARRKAILDGLAKEFKAKKARWREESQARRMTIPGDPSLNSASPSERNIAWALRAQLRDEKSSLREDYAFRKAALVKDLESRPLSAADKAEDLDALEAKRRQREIRLNDDFWHRRRESMLDEGARAESWNKTGIGGSHENDEGRFQEPAQRGDVL